ncbi:flavocytochrome c [Natranaerobius trueperi]|uniref:Flavocytochrome c n=1 Tax=Natranaerobius trueperi TaxID=759412 RepID=A0A226C0U4_9FIRM|nr:flavocytochrome c [Natranaerobius trueperi]OWZ84069.1 flavocytochrome c [Natranaerobius trueperi]
MWKKLSYLALAGLMTFSFTACEPEQDQEEPGGEETEQTDKQYDIAVIGGGGAGLAAATSAAEEGADVVVVEKRPMLGGNTLWATGGLNAAETLYQEEEGTEDNVETFYEDTMEGGDHENISELVEILTEESADSVVWLEDYGADLSDVGTLGGHSNPRTHRPAGGEPVGPEVVNTLEYAAEKQGVDFLLNTKGVEILTEEDDVSGVHVEEEEKAYDINSEKVIVATGGFGANEDMITEYAPELEGFATTNHQGATGTGIEIAQEVGADVIDMEMIQIHPTVEVESGRLITEAVRGNGAVLLNKAGDRFIDELDTREVVSEAILEQKGQSAFLFFDDSLRDSLGAIEDYVDQGMVTEGDNIEELAEKLDFPADSIEETVDTYNSYVDKGKDEDFGREDMNMTLEDDPYYAIEITPATHHTMGGLHIDTEARVLDEDGEPISGLFAAGECTGGIHGTNRLGGNALTDITVFGRIAGETAASELNN